MPGSPACKASQAQSPDGLPSQRIGLDNREPLRERQTHRQRIRAIRAIQGFQERKGNLARWPDRLDVRSVSRGRKV